MLLDLRSLVEAAAANSGSATYEVTVATGTGTVANPVAGTGEATYEVTATAGQGVVANPAVAGFGNTGVFYKPRPKQPPFQWPVPKAPTYHIHGTGQAVAPPLRVQGEGRVERYVIRGSAEVLYETVQTRAVGTTFRRRMHGTGIARVRATRVEAHGVYDRSLWDQIEDEDQWLHDVMQVLGVAA